MSKTCQRPKQSRNWCFTDYKFLDFKKIYSENRDIIRYVVWGKETCPKTKRIHNQGWIQLINKKVRGGVKRLLGSNELHCEAMYGTEFDNEKYCKKDAKWYAEGKFITQGHRSDLEKIKLDIENGATMHDIADDHFQVWCQYSRQFEKYKSMVDAKKTKVFRKIKVVVHHGSTGTGKTRSAMNACKNPYKIQGDELQWWDGYAGQKELIIDEYDNQIPCTKLLGILDGYQLRLPVKGGFTYAMWDTVYITTNLSKLHSNAKIQHRKALRRRITEYKKFAKAAHR